VLFVTKSDYTIDDNFLSLQKEYQRFIFDDITKTAQKRAFIPAHVAQQDRAAVS
jgi:hypothetical protein